MSRNRICFCLKTKHSKRNPSWLAFANLKHGEECFLWNLDTADLFHTLFAFFLFFEELAFTRDVTAVAFRDNVLAHCFNRLAGDDLIPDGGLYRYLKHLTGDELLHLRGKKAPFGGGSVRMKYQRKCVDGLTRHKHVKFNELAFL